MNENTYKITWANGSGIAKGKTLIQAVKKMKIKQKNIEVGMLVKIYHNGTPSWWDGRQFIKYAHLQQER